MVYNCFYLLSTVENVELLILSPNERVNQIAIIDEPLKNVFLGKDTRSTDIEICSISYAT
jgi:hypothetical protein